MVGTRIGFVWLFQGFLAQGLQRTSAGLGSVCHKYYIVLLIEGVFYLDCKTCKPQKLSGLFKFSGYTYNHICVC